LQLDSGNSATRSKLTLVRSLPGAVDSGKLAAQPRPAAPSTPAPAPATAPRPPEQLALTKPEPSPPPAKPVQPAPPKVEARQQARAEAPKAEPKEAPKPEAARHEARPNAEHSEVTEVVEAWARAWSAQDVKSYLAFYGNDFRTPGGQSRKAWEEDRRARIAGKGSIKVKVEAPQVSIDGNGATVRFRQVYVSDRLSATTRKTLVLAREGGRWKIRQETAGS